MPVINFCSRCLTMSTRPRISFNQEGVCNACLWTEKKKKSDWSKREKELKIYLIEIDLRKEILTV